jgi:hypothetical protein
MTAQDGEVCKSIVCHIRDHTLPDTIEVHDDTGIMQVRTLMARVLLGIATLSRAASRDSLSPSAPASDHALECLEFVLRSQGNKKEWKAAFSSVFTLLVRSGTVCPASNANVFIGPTDR